jgi:hypothetical protein
MGELAHPPIPQTLDEALSPEWLTAALSTRFPDVVVTSVSPGPVVSRVSTNARFRIHCADAVPAGLPEELCVKGYFTEGSRSARRAGVREALFYHHVAGATGVRTLPSVYTDVDEATQANVIITEDVVADGASFLDPLSPYSPDQVALSLEELAKLHSATWRHESYRDAGWLDPWLPELAQSVGSEKIQRNFDGPIGAGVPEAVRDASRLFNAYTKVAADAATAAEWSVIHGDAHVGNVFLRGDGRPSLVDWQLVQRGPWFLDVGYHIASTLTVEDRRSAEKDLVRHYLERLGHGGVQVPAESEVWSGLQKGFIHGFFLWGITVFVDPAITAALLGRLGTAVDDHQAFG